MQHVKVNELTDLKDRRGSYFSPGEIVAYNRSGEVHFGVLQSIRVFEKVITYDSTSVEHRYRYVQAIVIGEDGKKSNVRNYNSIVVMQGIPEYLRDRYYGTLNF